MSIYDRASVWFASLDGLGRAAMLRIHGTPLPDWVTASVVGAGVPTVTAQIPIGASCRTASFMPTILADFLAHEAPTMDVMLRRRLVPVLLGA